MCSISTYFIFSCRLSARCCCSTLWCFHFAFLSSPTYNWVYEFTSFIFGVIVMCLGRTLSLYMCVCRPSNIMFYVCCGCLLNCFVVVAIFSFASQSPYFPLISFGCSFKSRFVMACARAKRANSMTSQLNESFSRKSAGDSRCVCKKDTNFTHKLKCMALLRFSAGPPTEISFSVYVCVTVCVQTKSKIWNDEPNIVF